MRASSSGLSCRVFALTKKIAILATACYGFLFVAPSGRANHTPEPEIIPATFKELAACPLKVSTSGASSLLVAEELSDSVRRWNGRRIEIVGYMMPLVLEEGRARQFLIMRNQMACCYGQAPAANEYLVAKVPAPGVAVTMDTPMIFRGILRVAPVLVDRQVVEFYDLEDSATPAKFSP